MNTITLTLEATPENLKKISKIFDEQPPVGKEDPVQAVTTPATVPAKKVKDPAAEEAVSVPEVKKEMLRKRGVELTKAGKSDEFKKILKKYGAEKLSQIKEEDYASFYTDLMEVE